MRKSLPVAPVQRFVVRRDCQPMSGTSQRSRPQTATNILRSLVARLVSVDPDDITQLRALVVASDLPATRSWKVDTCQHGGTRFSKRVRYPLRFKRRGVAIEPSSRDLQAIVLFLVVIEIDAAPENLCGQLGLARPQGVARQPTPLFS